MDDALVIIPTGQAILLVVGSVTPFFILIVWNCCCHILLLNMLLLPAARFAVFAILICFGFLDGVCVWLLWIVLGHCLLDRTHPDQASVKQTFFYIAGRAISGRVLRFQLRI